MTEDTTRQTVRALLDQHGLKPTEREFEQLVSVYPDARRGADLLYTLPGVRYEDPALGFDPRR